MDLPTELRKFAALLRKLGALPLRSKGETGFPPPSKQTGVKPSEIKPVSPPKLPPVGSLSIKTPGITQPKAPGVA